MSPRVGIALLAAAFALAAVGEAADSGLQPIATVQLKDGRVLHNVRVMSDNGASVVLRADEGLFQVATADLPKPVTDTIAPKAPAPADPTQVQYVMERFDPNQPPAAPPPEPGKPAKPPAKPGASPVQAKNPAPNPVYRGCTIVSFQPKEFQGVQGCAEVVIENNTDDNVQLRPGEVTCVTADGGRHPGRNFVADTFPPSIRRRETVPAHGQITDIVTFTNDALNISAVQWVH